MTIERNSRTIHWDYVIALEDDLIRLSRFVDFSANDDTYSLEIARLLMTASAEADVVLKEICRASSPGTRVRTIGGYYPIVTAAHPSLCKLPVMVPRYGLTFRPWSGWRENSAPIWWTANNKIKHERAAEFRRANLKNCLNAVTGLFAAVLYLYRTRAEGGELHPPSALLSIPHVLFGSSGAGPHGFRAYYKLP